MVTSQIKFPTLKNRIETIAPKIQSKGQKLKYSANISVFSVVLFVSIDGNMSYQNETENHYGWRYWDQKI